MFQLLCKRRKGILIVVVLIVAFLIGRNIYMLHPPYLLVGERIYSTKSSKLNIDCDEKKYMRSLKNLKYFSELKTLLICMFDGKDELKSISHLKKLKDVVFEFSKIKDPSFLNTLPGLNRLHCCVTDINFDKIENDNLNKIELISCNVQNLDKLKVCKSLTRLEIFKGKFRGMVRNGKNYVIQDSSIFSELDNIRELDLTGSEIKDITGFLQMDSLAKIMVTKDSMTTEQIDEMKAAGIKVFLNKKTV